MVLPAVQSLRLPRLALARAASPRMVVRGPLDAATSFALAITSAEWQGGRGETPDNPEPLPLAVLAAGIGSLLFLFAVLVAMLVSKANVGTAKPAGPTPSDTRAASAEEDPIERLLNTMIASVPVASGPSPPPEQTKTSAEEPPGDAPKEPTGKAKGFGKPTNPR